MLHRLDLGDSGVVYGDDKLMDEVMKKIKKDLEKYRFCLIDLSKGPDSSLKKELRRYEIWVGYYHLGQGHHGSTEPQKVGEEYAIDFKTACIKHELKSKLKRIEEGELANDLNNQDYPWWFDEDKISNDWLGKYYETKDEALKAFDKTYI